MAYGHDRGYKLPKEIKEQRGTSRPCRENRNSVDIERGIPEPPKWLDSVGKEAYKEIVDITEKSGILSKADTFALSMLVDAYKMYLDARKDIKKNGYSFDMEDKQGNIFKRKNPMVEVAFESHAKIMSALRDFGLTPASRSKVSSVKDEKGDDDIKDLLN